MIAALGVVAIGVAAFVIPVVPRAEAGMSSARAIDVIKNGGLFRLNVGVFCLHLTQVALFVVVPPLLLKLGHISTEGLWKVYLPVIFISFLLMVPIIFVTEKRRTHTLTLRWAVLGLVLVGAGFALTAQTWWPLLICLTLFFVFFNVLEALQPSLVSRVAPPHLKGLALGLYNTTQAFGLFFGGVLGGWVSQNQGVQTVFWGLTAICAVWLFATWGLHVNMPERSMPMAEPSIVT